MLKSDGATALPTPMVVTCNKFCAKGMFCKLCHSYRSYGVLLWEIVTYGDVPLLGLTTESIIEEAHKQTLKHFP